MPLGDSMALTSVADALAIVLAGVEPVGSESVGLQGALNRTLARTVKATLTQPPFNASAMDGYAVRAEDAGAGARLRVAGTAAAGAAFGGALQPGQAVRIFTGAVVPEGADAVLIQENAQVSGDEILVAVAVAHGANIRPRGQDFATGETLITAGQKLGPRDVLLAAAAGHASLVVARMPRVAILATGNELVAPGQALCDGEIVASNGYGLAALVEAAGGNAHILPIARDDESDIAAGVRAADGADILLTIGGASVGAHDLVRPALERAGAQLSLSKVAMRPGKPVFFGTRVGAGRVQRCLGLPGNPVSAMIAARIFLVPLVKALLGSSTSEVPIRVRLAVDMPANGPRDHYMRAVLDRGSTPSRATPLANQDSSLISALAAAHCLLHIPAGAPAIAAGTELDALDIDI